MAHFAKPAEGSWTEHYPELGTGPVSYEDSISPEHYELERKAIFARTWLNVGRVEQLPRKGSYFTKELDAAGTSVVVVRGTGRRGPRLPQRLPAPRQQAGLERLPRARRPAAPAASSPASTTDGATRLDGELTFVQQESEFFDLDKDDYGLAAVQVETWEGFIFVNLDPDNTTSLADYLGELGAGLAGYPFDKMTQVYKYRADVGQQLEALHRRVRRVLPRAGPARQAGHGRGVAQAVRLSATRRWPTSSTAPTAWCRRGAACRRRRTSSMVKPIERVLRSGLFGPWDRPDIDGLDQLPPALNPARHQAWGVDSFVFFPNFMLLVWEPGWYLTYHYWPTSYNTHIFEGTLYFVPPEERPRAAAAGAGRGDLQGVRAPGRQHARGDPDHARVAGRHRPSRSTTRRSCSATCTRRPATTWPTTSRGIRDAGPDLEPRPDHGVDIRMTTLPPDFADLEPFADWALETEAERYAKRLSSTMDELQAFYDAAFPRLEDAIDYLDQFELDALPEDAERLLWLCYSLVNVSFPVEVWRQPRVPDSGAASMDIVVEPAV